MIENVFNEIKSIMALFPSDYEENIENATRLIVDSYTEKGKILCCGNGGSAADAQHFVGEMIGRFNFDRDPLSAISLHADTSVITAIGNDYGFDEVFSRQIKGNANKQDVVIGFSTSGRSPNILKAFKMAKLIGCKTIGFVGKRTEYVHELCDVVLYVPTDLTPRIQEFHTIFFHEICSRIERRIFNK